MPDTNTILAAPLLTSACDPMVVLTSACDPMVVLTSIVDGLPVTVPRAVVSIADQDTADADTLSATVGYVVVEASLADFDAEDVDAMSADAAVGVSLADVDAADSDALGASDAVGAGITDTDAVDADVLSAGAAVSASIADADATDGDALVAAAAVEVSIADADATDTDALTASLTAALADADAADADSLGADVAVTAALGDADTADFDTLAAAPAVAATLADVDAADGDAMTAAEAVGATIADADAVDVEALAAAPAVGATITDSDAVDTDALSATPASTSHKFLITPASTGTADLCLDLSTPAVPSTFWDHVSDGGDINVYDGTNGTTRLACHVVGFNKTNKTGLVFFAYSTSTSFYVVYGTGIATPAAGAQYGQYAAYETALIGCWHGADLTDATSNQNNGASTNPPSIVAAKLGKGFSFDSSNNQYLDVGNGSSLRYTANDMTIMAWINMTGTSGKAGGWIIINKCKASTYPAMPNPAPFVFYVQAGAKGVVLYRGNGSSSDYHGSNITPSTGAYHHVCCIQTGTTTEQNYMDGSAYGSAGNINTSIADQGTDCFIGSSVSDGSSYCAYGIINELRVYTRAFSATEYAKQFANQNNQATFWTIGSEL